MEHNASVCPMERCHHVGSTGYSSRLCGSLNLNVITRAQRYSTPQDADENTLLLPVFTFNQRDNVPFWNWMSACLIWNRHRSIFFMIINSQSLQQGWNITKRAEILPCPILCCIEILKSKMRPLLPSPNSTFWFTLSLSLSLFLLPSLGEYAVVGLSLARTRRLQTIRMRSNTERRNRGASITYKNQPHFSS